MEGFELLRPIAVMPWMGESREGERGLDNGPLAAGQTKKRLGHEPFEVRTRRQVPTELIAGTGFGTAARDATRDSAELPRSKALKPRCSIKAQSYDGRSTKPGN